MKKASLFMAIFISLPIWFYLLYKILEAVQATELMWFLYWIYIPSVIIGTILARAFEEQKKP